jgi:hypothetical protein
MPKTGGVFIRMLLERRYNDAILLPSGADFAEPSAAWEQHHSIDDVPGEYRDLPAVGFVRNPWDWYVSWYHFFSTYPYEPPHFMSVSAGKTLEFSEFMERIYSYPEDSEEYIDNSFSAKFYHIFGTSEHEPRNSNIETGRFETIHDDLRRFLARVGFDQETLDEIGGFQRINNSRHGHYSTYYSDTLAEQVYEHNRPIIEEFGYTFESK